MKTITDTLTKDGSFTILLGALKTAAFADTLRSPGPYTVFAPTDEAFQRLAPGALRALLKNVRKLQMLLTYHVVSGTVATKDVQPGELKTVEGHSLLATRDGTALAMNGSRVVRPDIVATNGLIHAVDTVIMPKALLAAAA